jgi:hypothetical protein
MGIIISYFINRSVCIKCHKKISNLHLDKICSACYFSKPLELQSAILLEFSDTNKNTNEYNNEWSIIFDNQSILEMPDFLPKLLDYTVSMEPLETSDILVESSITETVSPTPPELLLENHLIRSEATLTPNLRPT